MSGEFKDVRGAPEPGSRPETPDAQKTMYGRPEGFAEFAQRRTPEEVKLFARLYAHAFESSWFKYSVNPPTYTIDNMIIPAAQERICNLSVNIALGMGEISNADINAGLVVGKKPTRVDSLPVPPEGQETFKIGDTEYFWEEIDEVEAEKKRLVLAKTIEEELDGVRARQELVEKVTEQSIFKGDDGQYFENAFLRLGKARMEAKNIATILNLSETEKSFEDYGHKVEKAFDLIREVAAGKGVIISDRIDNYGNKEQVLYRLPNIFGVVRNKELLDIVIDQYIVPKIGFRNSPGLPGETVQDRAKRRLEELDNRAAAIEAFILIDHFDLEGEFGLGKNGYKEEWSLNKLSELDYEGAFTDWVKVAYVEQRRLGEWENNANLEKKGEKRKRREHPRVAGTPITLGCYPRLTTDMLSLLNTEVFAWRHKEGPRTKDDKKDGLVEQSKDGFYLGETNSVYAMILDIVEKKKTGKKGQEARVEQEKTKIRRILEAKDIQIPTDLKLIDKDNKDVSIFDMEFSVENGFDEQCESWKSLLESLKKKGYIVKHLEVKPGGFKDAPYKKVSDLLEHLTMRRLNLSIEEQVYNSRNPWKSLRGKDGEVGIVRIDGGNWNFRKKKLREIPWDSIVSIDNSIEQAMASATRKLDYRPAEEGMVVVEVDDNDEDNDEDKSKQTPGLLDEFALGITTNAYEVPYKLQGFYAHKYVFEQIMRVDYDKQYQEVISGPELLLKMNKGIDVSLGMVTGAFNVSVDTAAKLNNYVRTVFLGGLAASIIENSGKLGHGSPAGIKLEERQQVVRGKAKEKSTVVEAILEAVRVSQFLPIIENKDMGITLDPRYQALFDQIIKNRKAPSPFELPFFTEEEKDSLRLLYPHFPKK